MKLYSFLLAMGCLGGCAALAQPAAGETADSTAAGLNAMKTAERPMEQATNNPTYSLAILAGKDPHEDLARAEERMCSGRAPRRCAGALACAAKYALEAGENRKAHDYAVESLQSADVEAAMYARKFYTSPARSYNGVPTADFYGNFVLGRLAILDGNTRAAEQYLLASGRTYGDARLKVVGPNMSLALELLKHGDEQSRQVVLQFLDEVKAFWTLGPKPPWDEWASEISAGKTPVFRVGVLIPNLYN